MSAVTESRVASGDDSAVVHGDQVGAVAGDLIQVLQYGDQGSAWFSFSLPEELAAGAGGTR